MATEKTYNGDGSDTTFDITFPYLTHADIGVSVGGVTKTVGSDYSITGDTVTFTTAPATGTANVKLYRNTNIDTPEHEYSAGSSITAARLNENQKQALYAIEEAKLVTTTSGGITTGNKNDITVNSDTDWVIRANAVEKSMMADNSVGTDQIETNAVTAAELADNAVDTNAIVNLNVTTGKIANDAVNGTKIADDSIDSEHIAANSIDTEHYAPVSIDSDAIADNAVVQNKIVNDSVNETRLQISNTPTNGHVLTAQSSNTGGLTWAVAPTLAGSILETVSYICDGVSFTQRSVTYNSTAVTAAQQLTTTYAPVTGSTITYTPPSGAKTVVYEFRFLNQRMGTAGTLFHMKLWLDSAEVTKARYSQLGEGGGTNVIKWAFPIGGTEDGATGRVATWDSSKTIKLTAREYNDSTYAVKFHETRYWDGGYSDQLSIPTLTITAIA
tara:strand:+ start:978 stop:2306 length:1329 start_codon:yes stop_codon:yes gene_type:complete